MALALIIVSVIVSAIAVYISIKIYRETPKIDKKMMDKFKDDWNRR